MVELYSTEAGDFASTSNSEGEKLAEITPTKDGDGAVAIYACDGRARALTP